MAGNAPVRGILVHGVWLWVIISSYYFFSLVKKHTSLARDFTEDSGSEQKAFEMHCHYPGLNVREWGWRNEEIQSSI